MLRQAFRRTYLLTCMAIVPLWLTYATEYSIIASTRQNTASHSPFYPTGTSPFVNPACPTDDNDAPFNCWRLKTNLLYDAALMPSVEIEYRFGPQWSAAVEGNMAWWHNGNKHKYYQLATIIPEARYWFKAQGNRRGHYVGLLVGGGWYDLQNGGRGYKGEGVLAGIAYGYLFPVGKHFAFEASIGLGYIRTWYEEYLPIDRHNVYQQSSKLDYFGPVKLRFAWVWAIGK